jgi:hypothetical protein
MIPAETNMIEAEESAASKKSTSFVTNCLCCHVPAYGAHVGFGVANSSAVDALSGIACSWRTFGGGDGDCPPFSTLRYAQLKMA